MKGLLMYGNRKLPKSTAIFNMNSAKDCPSLKLGMCDVGSKCYALKAERLYPQVLPYRERQEAYWDSVNAEEFAGAFLIEVERKRERVTHLRFSEAGDFKSQADVDKMNEIAFYLGYQSITVYGYTARRDLDFSKAKHMTVLASGFTGTDGLFLGVKGAKHYHLEARKLGIRAFICPADCKVCTLCPKAKGKGTIIYAEMH